MINPKKDAPDALSTLGTILDAPMGRDAIHLAVMDAIAAHNLLPGSDVGLLPDGTASVHTDTIGIVDPFLNCLVKQGERFWLVVYPRQITSLRHVWTHPTIADEADPTEPTPSDPPLTPKAAKSKAWIEEYADSIGVDAPELMARAAGYIEAGYRWSEGDRFESERLPGEFWDHYETVTGTVVDEDDRGDFFSCSC